MLETLASDPRRPYTLADLRRTLGYSQGTMHALLSTMERAGYVRRDTSDRTYTLGPAMLPIGDAARRAYPIVDRALGLMHQLSDELDTECHAGMRLSGEILVVARTGPAQPLGVGVQVGERYPLIPPLGALHVAWDSPEGIEAYLGQAASELNEAEVDRQRQALAVVRKSGYSVHADDGPRQDLAEMVASYDGDNEEIGGTVRSLATKLGHYRYLLTDPADLVPGSFLELSAPVFDESGAVALVVGVSGVGPKISTMPVDEVVARVMATTQAITRSIEGRPPLVPGR